MTVVKRFDRAGKGFVVLPKLWIPACARTLRTLGWLNCSRRLAKDFEALIESSHAWVMLAIGLILLRRVAPGEQRAV